MRRRDLLDLLARRTGMSGFRQGPRDSRRRHPREPGDVGHLQGAVGRRRTGRDAMVKTYLKAGSLTTVRAAARPTARSRRAGGDALLALAFGSTAASAQETPPVGWWTSPAVAAPPPATTAVTDAEVAAQRQAMMDRMRRDWAGLCRHRPPMRPSPTRRSGGVHRDSITEFWGAAAPDLFRDGVGNRGIGPRPRPRCWCASIRTWTR